MTCNLATEHTARAVRWLDILRRQFPELVRELVPGSPGSSAASRDPLTPQALRSLAERDREDRTDREWVLGGGAAPLRLHVSDALRDITDGVVELEEAVRDKLGLGRARRAPSPSGWAGSPACSTGSPSIPSWPRTSSTNAAAWPAAAVRCWGRPRSWSGWTDAAPGATRSRCEPCPPGGRCSA